MKPKIKLERRIGRGWTGDFGKAGLGHWAEHSKEMARQGGFPIVRCVIVSHKDWKRIRELLEVST